MKSTEWKASDTTNAEFLGTMEIEKPNGEFESFEILLLRGDRYLFGNLCNVGFLESGYMKIENESGELEELHADLCAYYDDRSHNRVVCNERM